MKAITQDYVKYFKYIYPSWNQPTLTNNGIAGSSDMAVWHTFGGNNGSWGTTYTAFSPNGGYIGFYCDEWKSSMTINAYYKNPLKIQSISFFIPSIDDRPSGRAQNIRLYGDGNLIMVIGDVGENSWYSNNVNVNNFYNQYSLYVENAGWAEEDRVDIMNITINGVTRSIIEATSADYDYAVYLKKTTLFERDNKYYAVKS